MLHSPAIVLLAVYFFTQTFFGYTQQVPVECTDDIAEQLTARLCPKSLGELFKTFFIVQRERRDVYFSNVASITLTLYLLTVLLATATQHVFCKSFVCDAHMT